MENERIDFFARVLAELGVELMKLKRLNNEHINAESEDTVKRVLDGIFNDELRRCASLVDSQPNKAEDIGFTEKEIKKMPILKELKYRYRVKDRLHEFRYRRNGYNRTFSSTSLKEAKRKALEFCQELNAKEYSYLNLKSTDFVAFAKNYLLTVKQKNVTEKSFTNIMNRFNNYVVPFFLGKKVQAITAPLLQTFLNTIIDKGYKRTAEDCYYTLKVVLDYAVDNDIIKKNPIKAVKIPLHERVNGTALTLEEEKNFLALMPGHKYELSFIVLLYAGCRPCELETLSIDTPGFLTFRNLKQKKNKVVFKQIPITPMLAPYVERIEANLPLPRTTELAKIFSSLCPGHRMYDLRHTFSTRCQECGVPQEVVTRWMGHSANLSTNDRVYTHFTQKFMLEMAKRVEY